MDEDAPVKATDVFARNIGTITCSQQRQLQRSAVTVIGCGGLGGFVIEELARLGIGTLRLCDPDTFSTSNINRQLYAATSTLGRNKAVTAANRIRTLHDQTTVLPVTEPFQKAAETLFTAADVVVDCLDNTNSRLELARQCDKKALPLVHGAVRQWYGQIGVQLPGQTVIQQLYGSSEKHDQPAPSVLACTAALVASVQVAETCKLLLGLKSDLHNNWMSIDLRRLTFDIIEN